MPDMIGMGRKAPVVGASLKRRKQMKLITSFEAATLGTAELFELRKQAFIAFSEAPGGSQEQRNALLSMRAIEREIASRQPIM